MSGCNWFMLLLGFVVGITCGACGEADAHKEKYERERRELVERAEFWRHQLELFNEVRGYETLRHQ